MVRSVSSADADRSRLRLSRARRLTGMSTNPSRCETLWWSLSGCRSRSESSGYSETKKAAGPFKSTRSKRNSVFPWRRRSNSARSSASSTAPVSPTRRFGVGGASQASVVVSPIPISAAKRHRAAGPNQQAGSLPRTSGVYFLRLPDIRTCFLARPAVPPVRCSTIMGQPQVT